MQHLENTLTEPVVTQENTSRVSRAYSFVDASARLDLRQLTGPARSFGSSALPLPLFSITPLGCVYCFFVLR